MIVAAAVIALGLAVAPHRLVADAGALQVQPPDDDEEDDLVAPPPRREFAI